LESSFTVTQDFETMTFGITIKRGTLVLTAVLLLALPVSGQISAQSGTSVPSLPPCPDITIATQAATAIATAAATESAPATVTPTSTPTLEPTPTQNPNAAYLGIAATQVQKCGARIEAIKSGSPAEDAKIQVGDVVVAINGKPITGLADLRNAVVTSKKGDKLTLTIQRRVTQVDIVVTLGEIPLGTTATLPATASAPVAATAAATKTQ
jgi:predicted metalloprotease with PDZ domain